MLPVWVLDLDLLLYLETTAPHMPKLGQISHFFDPAWKLGEGNIWVKRRSVIGAPGGSFGFFTLLLIRTRKHQRRLESKIEAKLNLHFLTPVKFKEGWAKCLSKFFKFNLGPNLIYFCGGAIARAGQGCSNGKKGHEQDVNRAIGNPRFEKRKIPSQPKKKIPENCH